MGCDLHARFRVYLWLRYKRKMAFVWEVAQPRAAC